jgi:hypothetical protein
VRPSSDLALSPSGDLDCYAELGVNGRAETLPKAEPESSLRSVVRPGAGVLVADRVDGDEADEPKQEAENASDLAAITPADRQLRVDDGEGLHLRNADDASKSPTSRWLPCQPWQAQAELQQSQLRSELSRPTDGTTSQRPCCGGRGRRGPPFLSAPQAQCHPFDSSW